MFNHMDSTISTNKNGRNEILEILSNFMFMIKINKKFTKTIVITKNFRREKTLTKIIKIHL